MQQIQPSPHTPFYKQMIALLHDALNLLDEQGREEVMQFISSQQNADGGFRDRGGRSDLYYSLFGGLILKAGVRSPKSEVRSPKSEVRRKCSAAVFSRSEPVLKADNPQLADQGKIKLKHYISSQSSNEIQGFIEQCCLVLLQKELKTGWFSRMKTLMLLGRSFWRERQSINLSYRSFVLFLTLDAVFPFRGIIKLAAKRMMSRIVVDQHSPCSEIAAKVFLLKMLNQDGSKEQELLKSFACESSGFKAFQHLQQADMLSTAVALFALKYADCDLRILKPACLGFIEQNYAEGAFLSGDGDQTADVEYTFYGLLALGVLAK